MTSKKTIIYINGVENIVESCDFSQSISEYEKGTEEELTREEIIDYILEDY